MSKLRVLLIDIPTSPEDKFGDLHMVGSNFPPINLIFLGTMADELGADVKILPEHTTFAEMREELHNFKADIVGITFMSMSYYNLGNVLKAVKEHSSYSTVVVGGYHTTSYPREVLKAHDDIDCIFVGEADLTFSKFLKMYIENGNVLPRKEDLKSIPGVGFRDSNGENVLTAEGQNIEDLDILPFPNFDLLPGYFTTYLPAINRHFLASPQANLITTRGCPHSCTFCGRQLLGKDIRSYSIDYKIELIKQLEEKHGIKSITYGDEFLTYHKKETIKFCEALVKNKLDHITWSCSARVNNIDEEFAQALRAGGCVQLCYGIETADNELLRRMKKNATVEQAATALRHTRNAGIQSLSAFIIGSPGETEETLQKTYDFIMNEPLDYISLCYFTPLPGSDILDKGEWEEWGTLTNDKNFQDYTLYNHQPYVPNGFTPQELKAWRNKVLKNFYFNIPRILREFKFVTNPTSWKFFFKALKGIQGLTHVAMSGASSLLNHDHKQTFKKTENSSVKV